MDKKIKNVITQVKMFTEEQAAELYDQWRGHPLAETKAHLTKVLQKLDRLCAFYVKRDWWPNEGEVDNQFGQWISSLAQFDNELHKIIKVLLNWEYCAESDEPFWDAETTDNSSGGLANCDSE
jgi:hypothetical protein